jgi:PAS domain S-box-containing protein
MNLHLSALQPKTFAIAMVSVAGGLVLMLLLDPIASMTMTPFLLLYGAIVLASWWGGISCGWLATVLAAVVSSYFFILPRYALGLQWLQVSEVVRVGVFVGQGMVTSVLCGSLRIAKQRLDRSYLKLKDSEESLSHTNRWITAILESITEGFYAVDGRWQFVYINPQAESLLKRPVSDLLGQSIWAVMPGLEGSAMGRAFRQAMTSRRPVAIETVGVLHPDRLFEIHINPLVNGLAIYFRDITDQRKNAHQLQQQMEMLDLANDSIVMRELDSAVITYWNQGAARRYGWTAAEAIGQSAIDLLQTVLPEPMEVIRAAVLRDGCWAGELMQTTRDGRTLIIKSRWTLQQTLLGQPGTILEIGDDVTLERQAAAALRKSEIHFRTLANSMPQMFWTACPEGQLQYCNERWYAYTGLTPAQSFDQGWLTVLHPEDRDRCQRCWQEALQTGQALVLEARPRHAKDDQYRWHLVRAFPLLGDGGEVVQWFTSLTDIHDQKLALEERDRALALERAARTEAEAANRIKDEFLAILSHELRTPLNPIIGWVSLLRSRPLDESTQARALETIERNAKIQADLIEDLLDVSRILRGKLVLDTQTVKMESVIRAALETVQLSAQVKGIALRPDLDPAVGVVSGDPNRLQQVVWNLLTNAIKFTPKGGVVTVRLYHDNHDVIIEVQDTGQGISPEFLPHVFDHFRQADSSSTRNFGGLGLGLAIVRYLSEQHGGEVAVSSPGEGQGATFTVRLPRSAAPVANDPAAIAAGETVNLAGRQVLVVDDDADSLHLIKMLLQDCAMEVLTAPSTEEGLRLASQHHPDVLISDIGMPEQDGYMLIRALRQRSAAAGGTIPAIALTAYAGVHNRDRVLQAGFQRHLAKPVDLGQLKTAIAELVVLN